MSVEPVLYVQGMCILQYASFTYKYVMFLVYSYVNMLRTEVNTTQNRNTTAQIITDINNKTYVNNVSLLGTEIFSLSIQNFELKHIENFRPCSS